MFLKLTNTRVSKAKFNEHVEEREQSFGNDIFIQFIYFREQFSKQIDLRKSSPPDTPAVT